MTKQEKERKQQKKYYETCLSIAKRVGNKQDIEYYTRQLKLMETVDFLNENFD